ncbi:MAG TPA: hypothetical protein VMP11_14070 [Verrucomicrobiae bacterium]|nr:hypothetical protein [Verrucomicrobiae bacterium]
MREVRLDWFAVGLACLCVALRWWLVAMGGQDWFPDEKRFWWSGVVVYRLSHGAWRQALEPILKWNQHPGFTCLGCLPVSLYSVWAGWHAAYYDIPFEDTVRFSAAFLSLASVVSIVLVRSIVLRAGGSLVEARLTMALMAGSSTMFYYARHVLPYDASLALALASLAVGMQRGGSGRLVMSGWLIGAAFMTYYGYWAIAVVVSVAVLTWKARTTGEAAGRCGWFAMGALSWLGVFAAGRFVILGGSFLQGMTSFAGTVTKGVFEEGWTLPWAYLWHAEHGLLIYWLVAIVASIVAVARRRQVAGHAVMWVSMAAAVYVLLVVSSVVLHQFVVYGRTARQLVPFLCMVGGSGGARLWEVTPASMRRRLLQCGVVALLIQSVWNIRVPLQQWFPIEVKGIVARDYGAFSEALTINGPKSEDGKLSPTTDSGSSRYVLVNAEYLAPVLGPKAPPEGHVLMRFAHPTQFLPYQYEEFTPREREILRETDISIRLIDTSAQPELANPHGIP